MRKILAFAASLCFFVSAAAAQAPSQSAASKSDLLSMDQKVKIAQLITKADGATHKRQLFNCG